MIKLVFDKEIKEKHRILCPCCNHIIDVISKTEITKVPSDLALSIQLISDSMGNNDSQVKITPIIESNASKPSLNKIEVIER